MRIQETMRHFIQVQKYVNIMLTKLFRTVGPTYLRDLILHTNDTDTSNLVESYDGIYRYKKQLLI
jgi:hypothetical protein